MDKLKDLFKFPKSEIRSRVIDDAVKVEWLINSLLSTLLGIDKDTSKSFGNKSGSLSFYSKVNLLLDLQIMKNGYKDKILAFSEIRNQFAHNYSIQEFIDSPKELKNKLIKWYGDNVESPDFDQFYIKLIEDVQQCILDLFSSTMEMASNKGEVMGNLLWLDLLREEIKMRSNEDENFAKVIVDVYKEVHDKYTSTKIPHNIIGKISIL